MIEALQKKDGSDLSLRLPDDLRQRCCDRIASDRSAALWATLSFNRRPFA